MRSLKQVLIVALILMVTSTTCHAEDSVFKSMFQDIVYGGLSGGLVGAAVLAFTRHPDQHLDYMGYGAAAGALIGATYGAVSATRSLAEVKDGEVRFAMPTIIPELRESRSGLELIATAELLRGTF